MDRTLLCKSHGYSVWNSVLLVAVLWIQYSVYQLYEESGELMHLGLCAVVLVAVVILADNFFSEIIIETDASTLYVRPKNKVSLKKNRALKKVDIQNIIIRKTRGRRENRSPFYSYFIAVRLINGDGVELLEARDEKEADRIAGLLWEATGSKTPIVKTQARSLKNI